MPREIPSGFSFGLLERDIARETPNTLCAAASKITAIPRSDWQPTPPEKRDLVKTIFSQIDGHCSSNAAAGAVMFQRARQGLPHVVLSPEALYATHSSWGTGSTLAENLEALCTIGIPSRDSMRQQNWGRLRTYGEASEEALCYRVDEWLDCGSDVDLYATGLQLGLAGPIGVLWNHSPRGGHSILGVELKYRSGRWKVIIANSWGTGEGDGGFDELDLDRDIAPYSKTFGMWLCQSVIEDTWTKTGDAA